MATFPPNIAGTGGYTPTGSGAAGYFNGGQAMPFYQGNSVIANIPQFQRQFNIRDGLVTKITEGRSNMMRVMMDYARKNGAYITTDVQSRWPIEHAIINRFYLKVQVGQGGTAGSKYSSSTFTLASAKDANRLQPGDLMALMCSFTPPNRDEDATLLDYSASATKYYKTIPAGKVMAEVVKVTAVDGAAGKITVLRNQGGDGQTSSRQGVGFTVVANPDSALADAGANSVRAEDAFLVKMGNAMIEGSDDQQIFSTSNTFDYNYCQYVMRKWGTTDIQENVNRLWQSEKQGQKNRREANDSFWDELEWQAIFGYRKEEEINGKWRGYAGGILETIPTAHIEQVEGMSFADDSKMGDFTIPKFNKLLENKFYFGTQEKILLCGVNYHTAFSVMINKMTQNIPTVVDSWGVKGHRFMSSNGGNVTVVPSDKLSLNGMSDYAILFDPSCFQYGHLQNMDINVIEENLNTNPHEKSGEIYGVITYKRTNPDANWLFTMKPNAQ